MAATLSVAEALQHEGLPSTAGQVHRHLIYASFRSDGDRQQGEAFLGELSQAIDLRWRSVDGTPVDPVPEAWPALAALLRYSERHGRHLVLEQEVAAMGRVMQLLWMPASATLLVRVGPEDTALPAAPPDAWSKLGLEPVGDWTTQGDAAVWAALGGLDETHRDVLSGVRWTQRTRGRGAAVRWKRQAPYQRVWAGPGTAEGTLYGPARIGPPESAVHLGVEIVAHETGHLMEGIAWQRANAESPGSKGRRCARQAWKQMLASYADVMGMKSPSDYGVATAREGFAEAWAFYVLHPDYLLRVAPDAHRWFEDGHHLSLPATALQICLER